MRAIQIDPNMTTVDEVDIGGGDLYEELHQLFQGPFKKFTLANGQVLLTREGPSNRQTSSFLLDDLAPIATLGLILSLAGEGFTDATRDLEEVSESVVWMDGEVEY